MKKRKLTQWYYLMLNSDPYLLMKCLKQPYAFLQSVLII
jgi:hypothetical protein